MVQRVVLSLIWNLVYGRVFNSSSEEPQKQCGKPPPYLACLTLPVDFPTRRHLSRLGRPRFFVG